MKLQIRCLRCQTVFRLDENKLQGKPVRFNCQACQQTIVLKPTQLGLDIKGGIMQWPFSTSLPNAFADLTEVQRLASGGMSEIYLAKMGGAEGFERQVALKVLHPHLCRDESFVQAMVEEAKLSVLLHHPNIVQVFNLRKYGEVLYLVMEYVPGKSLGSITTTYLQKGALVPVEMCVFIVCEVLEGLAFAHGLKDAQGQELRIVHRDISPQNILVNQEGWVKIIDFGIAKAANRLGETLPGMIKGKVAYMAPEQFEGKVDHRSDLFATGAVLWEALAGYPLFAGPNALATMHKLLNAEPPPIHQLRPEVPRAMDAVLQKALAKNPDQRYQGAREMKAALLEACAPISLEQLRGKVDIEAAGVTAGSPAVLPSITLSLESEKPPAQGYPDEPAREGVSWLRQGVSWAGSRRWTPVLLGLGALIVLGALALLRLPGPAGDRSQPAVGAQPPPPLQVPPAPPPLPAAPPQAVAAENPGDKPRSAAKPARPRKLSEGTTPKAPKAAQAPPPALDSQAVLTTLQKHDPELQQCVTTHLSNSQRAQEVKITLRLGVDREGVAREVQLSPRFVATSSFGMCLETALRQIRFPRHPQDWAPVELPLTFQVKGP